MSSNKGAEKPTLKYSRSSPCFHNNSWYLVKMRPSMSVGEVSPCLTGQIHVKSIVSEFKDSGSNNPLSEWSCPGMISRENEKWSGDGRTFSFYIRRQMVHFTGGKQGNKDHKRRVDKLLKCRQERFDLCCIHIVSLVINHHR